jgi:DNA-binding NarL/FixJ family response regulator
LWNIGVLASRRDFTDAARAVNVRLERKGDNAVMRVLIVDDHPIIVAGCAAMLADEGGIEVFDANNADEGLNAYVERRPDIAVVDISLPGASGFELTRRILRHDAAARIVIFSMNDDPIFAARAIEAGAKGYVTKNDDPYLLLQALREVMAGGVFLMPSIAKRLAFKNDAAISNPLSGLSARELEILHLLGRGLGMAEIADAAGVSYKTIANSCSIMKRKLRARTPMDLVRIAIEHGRT